MSSEARFWTRRMRWRLRGALQWPTFAAATALDGLILHLLPPWSGGFDLIFGFIVASFGNLVLVGLIAPWLVRRLVARQRLEPAPAARRAPPEVVLDRTATALLVAGVGAVIAVGLAARPVVVSPTEDAEQNADVVRSHVARNATPEVRRNLDSANTLRLGEGYFRTCIALDDRTKAYCLFVDTRPDPPTVDEDPNPVPNAEFPGGRGAR